MSQFKFEYLDIVSSDVEELMHLGHLQDEKKHDIKFNYKKFMIVIRDQNNNLVGALIAYTVYKEIYVDDIWVDPLYRNKGLGRQLLKILEDQFKEQGYHNINLVTSEFQASDFYKKCGFEVEFVRINKKDSQFTKTFFIKYLND